MRPDSLFGAARIAAHPPLAASVGRQALIVAAMAGALGAATPAFATPTPAGTRIENTATLSYDGPTGSVELPSNTIEIIVDEILDVTVASDDSADIPTGPGQTNDVHSFTVTNTGNGSEGFVLTADVARGGDDFDPSLVSIVIDSDDDGAYSPGTDTVYVAGSNNPLLVASGSVTIFVLTATPESATDGQRALVSLTATAVTGSGDPGTAFDGQGDGGGDAVVGTTRALAADEGGLIVRAISVGLSKSASIRDPFGGDQPVPGATITYSLTATVTGTGTASGLVIRDDVPEGTVYASETLTLEGVGLTDNGADSDAGQFDGDSIAVTLGDVAGGETRTATFQVTIE